MPKNKSALIRYHILDTCFRNTGRKYFIEDLIQACSDRLSELSERGKVEVSRETIFKDINFMKSSDGWNIELDESCKDAARRYYRYLDPSFSIQKLAISTDEHLLIRDTMHMLNRFQNLPFYDMLNNLVDRLSDGLKISLPERVIIGYEHETNLYDPEALDLLRPLHKAIVNKQVLLIKYQSVRSASDSETFTISPYYLKQYKNRWYLLGLEHQNRKLYVMGLERISKLKDAPAKIMYIDPEESIIENHFEDIVGVTRLDGDPITITIWVNPAFWHFLKYSPIHHSQKSLKKLDAEGMQISIRVIPNRELSNMLMSYGENIRILGPEPYVKEFKQRLKQTADLYKKN